MKTKSLLSLLIIVAIAMYSCKSPYSTAAYGDTETEVIGTEYDGVYIVRATGRSTKVALSSVTRTAAMTQAKKRAVYDITFSILNSKVATMKSLKPVLTEVNAREKYQEYFDNFFSEKGDWTKYASNAGTRYVATKFYSTSTDVTCTMCVKVNRKALIARFKEDNILK